MIAVLSVTEDDNYAMPLPFAVYSWLKAGATGVIVFCPDGDNPKIELAKKYCNFTTFIKFSCEEKRISTYSQVIRLFGGAIRFADASEGMITGDSDMCVFSDFFKSISNDDISIIGADLTPQDQVPMCYLKMPIYKWRTVMNCYEDEGKLKTPQQLTSELIDPIEGINIRGEQWSYDQWYAKKMIDNSGEEVIYYNRSNGITQFAQNRADRDGWHFNPDTIIDAHLPRPLTEQSNFDKVYDLFRIKYPNDDLQWMIDFRNEYLKLL